jgi:secondary thiamine-phosphate synthase enzyme
MWVQREITLREHPRGFHLITRAVAEAMPEVGQLRAGLLHVFIRHTSASLTINENASRDVLRDFAAWFDRAVPDGAPYFEHTLEGADDMPAHIKASLLDTSLTIPVSDGGFAFGTWQGIYLCEHRDSGGPRSVTVTAWGEERG